MATNFLVNIVNVSKTMLNLRSYPRLKPPAGMLTVWEPTMLPQVELQTRAAHKQTGTGTVRGLTEAAFSIRFRDFWGQFTQDASKMWQFQGGDVIVHLELLVLVTTAFEGKAYRDDVFSLIMTHELKHWRDAEDIANGMPEKLQADPDVKRLLVDAGKGMPAKLSDADFRAWFVTANPATNGTQFEDLVCGMMEAEHDRLHELRDTSAEYETYSQNVSALRQNLPKQVKWP